MKLTRIQESRIKRNLNQSLGSTNESSNQEKILKTFGTASSNMLSNTKKLTFEDGDIIMFTLSVNSKDKQQYAKFKLNSEESIDVTDKFITYRNENIKKYESGGFEVAILKTVASVLGQDIVGKKIKDLTYGLMHEVEAGF